VSCRRRTDGIGGRCRAACHDAIPNVRFASKLKLSATHGFISSTTTLKLLRVSRLPNTYLIDIYSFPMRFPTFPTLLRTFHTVSNTTSAFFRSSPAHSIGRTLYNTPQRAILYRSMPNIPFLGALFGSSSSMADNTNYPVQKTEGEWQAQLSPGGSILYLHCRTITDTL
jgi:hypothetical protein